MRSYSSGPVASERFPPPWSDHVQGRGVTSGSFLVSRLSHAMRGSWERCCSPRRWNAGLKSGSLRMIECLRVRGGGAKSLNNKAFFAAIFITKAGNDPEVGSRSMFLL